MNIKLVKIAILAAVAVINSNAQIRPTAFEWRATVKALDENSQPVPEAEIIIGFSIASPEGEPISDKIVGQTDTNGVFTAKHTDRSVALGIRAQKQGHYPFWMQHYLGFSPEDHPDRLVPEITVVLKRTVNPIPMYAKPVNLGMPAFEKSVGFDLMAGDWVVPYGNGASVDIILMAHLDKRSENDSDYTLTVSFPNVGDGIQEFRVPPTRFPTEGSALRSPHEAPAENYQPQWVQTSIRRPGQPIQTNRDEKRNYFLRVRTVLEENGKVKSALYGKIYGDFMQFTYYLNPTPNDRNVEFDPKQNLLQGLKSTERVNAP
jgi:hypothetical protein